MSSGKVHVMIGLGVTAVAIGIFYNFFNLQVNQIPVFALIVFLFSQLPDVDHKNSNITWLFFAIGIFFLWAGYFFQNPLPFLGRLLIVDTTYLGMMIVTVTFLAAKFVPHRGPTHTIWFMLFAPIIILTIPGVDYYFIEMKMIQILVVAMIAIYSHLAADGYIFKLSLKPKEGRW